MKRVVLLFIFCVPFYLQATIFDKLGKEIEKTGKAIGTGAKKAVKAVSKAGKDAVEAVKDPGKLAKDAMYAAVKSMGVDIRKIENNVVNIQRIVSMLQRDIDALQAALKAPKSPEAQMPTISQRLKTLQKELENLKAQQIAADDIKKMLSSPEGFRNIFETVTSPSLRDQLQRTYQAYDALLGAIDTVEINPILQTTRKALLDMERIIGNALSIRQHAGVLAKIVVAPRVASALQAVSESLRLISADLARIIQGGRTSLRSSTGEFVGGLLNNLGNITKLVNDLLYAVKTMPQYVTQIKGNTAHMMQLKNKLISTGTGIGSRLESLIKAKVKTVKGTFDVPRATGAELGLIIKELKQILNGIFIDLRNVIASAAGAILVGVNGINAFKVNIGFNIVTPQSAIGLTALPKDVNGLSYNTDQLRIALPLR